MEWWLVLIGVAYSIWSSFKKDQREREQRETGAQEDPFYPPRTTDRTRTTDRPRTFVKNAYPQHSTDDPRITDDPRPFSEWTLAIDEIKREFNALRSTPYEARFADTNVPIETRKKTYDDIPSYDGRVPIRNSEHQYESHFKLNEGLRKDTFRVGSNFADELVLDEPLVQQTRSPLKLDRDSLKSYVIMHEVLGKPKSMEALERQRRLRRHDIRHGRQA